MRVRYSRATPGCPPARAEITPVEPDPGRTGEGSAPTVTSHDETPSWGIEPVPDRLRVLGFVDTFLLWTNLGISLLVLVAASYFGLSLRQARPRDDRRRPDRERMLALAALIGADARVPTMVLQRAPLGRRGSYLATGLNVVQCLGWSVFELIVIATAAGALSRSGLRLRGRLGMEARVRCARDRTRAPRADRLRPPLREARSGSGRSRPPSSTSPGGSSTTPTSPRSGTRAARAARSGSPSIS